MIMRKKGLVMGVLVILLILTGYLNHIYNLKGKAVSNDRNNADDIIIKDTSESGETILDEDMEVSASSFFKDFRYDRTHTREKEIEYIQNLLDNPNSIDERKAEAHDKLLKLTNIMEKELIVEGLIKAKGFNDAIVILQEHSVNVVIDKGEPSAEEVAQILDIVRRETGQSAENIKITPKS
ncbi:MAG: SpoIIIAH-like family protein [Clostridiales bacterium]|nr:SpoIIIAH-like family protein [Clostridiales bacterium]